MKRYYFSFLIYFSIQFVGAQIPEPIKDSIQNHKNYYIYDSVKQVKTDLKNKEGLLNFNSDVVDKKRLEINETAAEGVEKKLDQIPEYEAVKNQSNTFSDSLENTKENYESYFNPIEDKSGKIFSSASDSLILQKEKFENGFDVNEILEKYDKEMLEQLPPVNAAVIKDKKIPVLDSLREFYLKHEKLKLHEKELSDNYKEAALMKKESLLQRSFFDGIFGISEDFTALNISPAYGIQISQRFSLGLGINLGINLNTPSENVLVGLRSFGRYEILKKKLYIQIEDNSYWPGVSYPNWEEELKESKVNHAVSVGGGYLINFSSTKSLNFAILYQVNQNSLSSTFNSPVVMRLGMSFYNEK